MDAWRDNEAYVEPEVPELDDEDYADTGEYWANRWDDWGVRIEDPDLRPQNFGDE